MAADKDTWQHAACNVPLATLNIWLVPFHFNRHIMVTSCLILTILTAALNVHWLIVSTLQMTTSFELPATFNEQTACQSCQPMPLHWITDYILLVLHKQLYATNVQLLSRVQVCFPVGRDTMCPLWYITIVGGGWFRQIPFYWAFYCCCFENGTFLSFFFQESQGWKNYVCHLPSRQFEFPIPHRYTLFWGKRENSRIN